MRMKKPGSYGTNPKNTKGDGDVEKEKQGRDKRNKAKGGGGDGSFEKGECPNERKVR